jgi:hypothetical protein
VIKDSFYFAGQEPGNLKSLGLKLKFVATHRLPGILAGRRDFSRVFFVIFAYPGRRRPGDFGGF